MRIVDVRTVLLTGPCTSDPYVVGCRLLRSAAFIEIEVLGPDGQILIGVGETYAGYFIPEAVPPMVHFHKPSLVG